MPLLVNVLIRSKIHTENRLPLVDPDEKWATLTPHGIIFAGVVCCRVPQPIDRLQTRTITPYAAGNAFIDEAAPPALLIVDHHSGSRPKAQERKSF